MKMVPRFVRVALWVIAVVGACAAVALLIAAFVHTGDVSVAAPRTLGSAEKRVLADLRAAVACEWTPDGITATRWNGSFGLNLAPLTSSWTQDAEGPKIYTVEPDTTIATATLAGTSIQGVRLEYETMLYNDPGGAAWTSVWKPFDASGGVLMTRTWVFACTVAVEDVIELDEATDATAFILQKLNQYTASDMMVSKYEVHKSYGSAEVWVGGYNPFENERSIAATGSNTIFSVTWVSQNGTTYANAYVNGVPVGLFYPGVGTFEPGAHPVPAPQNGVPTTAGSVVLSGPTTMYYAGVWNEALTDAEHATMAAFLTDTFFSGATDFFMSMLSPPRIMYVDLSFVAVFSISGFAGTEIAPITIYAIDSSFQFVTCSVDLGAVTGLTLNATTGEISGTPTAAFAGVIIITAHSASGTGSTSLTLSILPSSANDPAIQYSPRSVIRAYAGFPLSPAYSVVVTNAIVPAAYAIDVPLPAGLVFNTATGTISGTPTAPAAVAPFRVMGTLNENSGFAYISIEVVDTAPPATPVLTLSAGGLTRAEHFASAIDPIVLVNTGGETITEYSISPDITALTGLAFDPATGAVSGTPTMVLTDTQVYTISVAGAGGSAELVFSLRITLRHSIQYATDALTFAVGTAVTQRPIFIDLETNKRVSTVPEYLADAQYRLENVTAPIDGVQLNASTGELAGTPTAMSSQQLWNLVAFTDAVSISGSVLVRCNGTFEFSGAATALRTGAPVTLTPVFSHGQTPLVLVTGPKWPAFLRGTSSKSLTVSGTPNATGRVTLDCTAYFADGQISVCSQEVDIRKGAASSTTYNPPMLYAGAASAGAALAGAVALFATRAL